MPWFRSLFGAALLAGACTAPPGSTADPLLLDFGKGGVESWRALNDGVMGGRSIGVVDYSRKTLTWAGTVSLENNGGFSSVRSEWGDRDLSAFTSVTFRCRTTTGEADDFTLTMETAQQWWLPYWKANFTAKPKWEEVTLDFSELKKSSAMTGDLPKPSWGCPGRHPAHRTDEVRWNRGRIRARSGLIRFNPEARSETEVETAVTVRGIPGRSPPAAQKRRRRHPSGCVPPTPGQNHWPRHTVL